MAFPRLTIAIWLVVALVSLMGIAGSVSVARLRSRSRPSRAGLIVLIWVAVLAAIGWLIFVAPVYLD